VSVAPSSTKSSPGNTTGMLITPRRTAIHNPNCSRQTQAPILFNLAESARGGNTDNVHDYVERTAIAPRLSNSSPLPQPFICTAEKFELELINKTNQFDTTGRRWTKQECIPVVATGTRFIAFDVEDRFTRYGIVGVVVVRGSHIAQLVMSCRFIGMAIEIAALSEILRVAREGGFGNATASLAEPELNFLCRDLYARCGFSRDGDQWA
jgi:hypothetical protein